MFQEQKSRKTMLYLYNFFQLYVHHIVVFSIYSTLLLEEFSGSLHIPNVSKLKIKYMEMFIELRLITFEKGMEEPLFS